MPAVTVRLPHSVAQYLERRSREFNQTKTQVVIKALDCLRQREFEAVMAEGYAAQAAEAREAAEAMLPAGAEIPSEE